MSSLALPSTCSRPLAGKWMSCPGLVRATSGARSGTAITWYSERVGIGLVVGGHEAQAIQAGLVEDKLDLERLRIDGGVSAQDRLLAVAGIEVQLGRLEVAVGVDDEGDVGAAQGLDLAVAAADLREAGRRRGDRCRWPGMRSTPAWSAR